MNVRNFRDLKKWQKLIDYATTCDFRKEHEIGVFDASNNQMEEEVKESEMLLDRRNASKLKRYGDANEDDENELILKFKVQRPN